MADDTTETDSTVSDEIDSETTGTESPAVDDEDTAGSDGTEDTNSAMPEVTDEHREKAKEMARECDDNRPTLVMPGTDGAVTGTAVGEWLDEDGNPKYHSIDDDDGDQQEDPRAEDDGAGDGEASDSADADRTDDDAGATGDVGERANVIEEPAAASA